MLGKSLLLSFVLVTSPGEWALAVYLRTSPWSGTLVTDIVSVVTQHGLHARMQNFTTVDDLRGFLQRGEITLPLWIHGMPANTPANTDRCRSALPLQ